MVKSNITIEIDSRRCSRTYEVMRFTEFDISLDLETDADTFDVVAENPDGVYTGLFCRFDNCRLKINGKTIMKGNLDSVTYYLSGNSDYIKLTGRDLCWLLVDNDALPDTIENLQPKAYIERKCASYGIKCVVSNADIYSKLVIGCEESEISIMNNILLDSKQRVWYLIDTLYTGKWATDAKPSHVFSMSKSVKGIPIMSIQYSEDGADMISKMLVYGSDGNGGQKIMGQYDNQYMINKGIKKRCVKRHYSDNAASKYTSVAEREVRDNFRDDTELTITVPIIKKKIYMPNTTAQVIIDRLGIDALFFIKSVQYVKGIGDGGSATLKLIPADTTFELLWNSSTAISLTKYTKLSKKLASSKTDRVYSQSTINSNYNDQYTSGAGSTGGSDGSDAYFPACAYTGISIVDGLKSVGAQSSYSYRGSIAIANGIAGYEGTSAQNTQMLNLLKAGKLKKPQ